MRNALPWQESLVKEVKVRFIDNVNEIIKSDILIKHKLNKIIREMLNFKLLAIKWLSTTA